MSIEKRRRLSPEESRSTALEFARELLIEAGPQAVTLKAVGARMGRTHANLLHHFGSAFELQKALATHLADTVCAKIGAEMLLHPPGTRNIRQIVDMIFDAFDSGGAAGLSSWMLLTGNENALDPIIAVVHSLIDTVTPNPAEKNLYREDTVALMVMALGDAQIGTRLAGSFNLPRDTARVFATDMIQSRVTAFIAKQNIAN
jgi:AcrR family transcriptional regulator